MRSGDAQGISTVFAMDIWLAAPAANREPS